MGTKMCTRGRFLQVAGAVSAASALFAPLATHAAVAGEDRILVLVAQIGGCDLLNTVLAREQYGAYHDLRRPQSAPYDKILDMCVPESDLQPAALSDRFALHPRMRAFKRLYDEGRLAVTVGLGLPACEPNRLSHEAARFDWHTGTLGRLGRKQDGWLARAVDSPSAFPVMVSTSGTVPVVFQGRGDNALALGASLEDFGALGAAMPSGTTAGTDALRNASAAVQRTLELSLALKSIAESHPAGDYPKGETDLDNQLKTVARLIASANGCRTYFVAQDGYDTHAEQNRTHPDLLGTFSGAIARFYEYLRDRGLSRNVVIASMTDFGRRAQPDGNFGTDHGTAAASFVIGDDVRGGMYGEYPKLSKLDGDGNLEVLVDFRDHLATLATYLRIDKERAGLPARDLGFLRGA